MSRSHVDHKDIAKYAVDKVNLPKTKADEYRAQARRLREKLEGYLNDHPDFTLRKMLISGSLAKGTALRSINDIDIACYINAPDAPKEIGELLEFIADKLRKAFPNFSPEQVTPQTYSISVNFRGSGLNVDIVPVLYYGDEDWYGELVSQDDGSFLKTSIPRHLAFAKKRKQDNPIHFSQVVRLIKHWARKEKRERDGFRFKSFMIEMVLAKLSDEGLDFSDYPEALQHFFTYIARTEFNELVAFSDFFPIPNKSTIITPIKIVDPVNTENIVSQLYTSQQADIIVEAALDAGDSIDAALSATTKQDTVYYWQKILGQPFKGKDIMSYSYTSSQTQTFTVTHAKHIAAKVATDLKRMQRFYGHPSDASIEEFEAEVIEYLKQGYLNKVTYGFKKDNNWIEPTLVYEAKDLGDAHSDDPGKIRPGRDIAGASFYSFLEYSGDWGQLSMADKEAFKQTLPFPRTTANTPGINGYLENDRTYASGGKALSRATVRNYA